VDIQKLNLKYSKEFVKSFFFFFFGKFFQIFREKLNLKSSLGLL
jgi:hypothetical protein